MSYKFTHKIEFILSYTFKGENHTNTIEYCNLRVTEDNYEELKQIAINHEMEVPINQNEGYYGNFVKIIQKKHNFEYPNENFVSETKDYTDEDFNKFVKLFHIIYPAYLINKPPTFEFIKSRIEEKNKTDLKNLNFKQDVVITRIIYRTSNIVDQSSTSSLSTTLSTSNSTT